MAARAGEATSGPPFVLNVNEPQATPTLTPAAAPTATNTVVISLILFVFTLIVTWRVLRQLDLAPGQRWWILLAYALESNVQIDALP